MATIAEQKGALQKWTPVIIFNVILKDNVPRYWAKQTLVYVGNTYSAIVLEHSELKIEGNGVYGVDAVAQIGLTLNNADANLNSLIAPANWQGGVIQPRFIFVSPDGETTTDAIIYPKFLIDLPTSTWPRIEFSAHNKWNLARKMLPASLVTKKDRYPFPDTAAERAAAGYDPASEFFAIGYDPDTGKGNMKPGGGYYQRHEYDGTREKLREIGLEVRFGGFGRVPPTVVGTPSKGQKAEYVGNANEAKYGQAVPLVFGTCRIQPVVLDTGFPSGEGGWNGARLSHYLLSDGVNFGPEGSMGIEDVLDVFIPDNPKFQRIPETSGQPQVTGAWSFQGGYYGSQKAPASSKYRNIDPAIDFPDPLGDFTARDLYSGLAYLEIGFPKELSGQDGIGPKLEAIVKGLKVETWNVDGSISDWYPTANPVWIFVHLLKLLRWSTDDMDKAAIYQAAAYCEEIVDSGKPRFRCNLALTQQTRAADILRGIRNNCRMYTSFAPDGKLQLKIAQNVAGEGGLAFALDNTTIMRGDDGQLMVEKFHRSVFETANTFTITFQNEDNFYNTDSFTRTDIRNVNQIDEKISADSIFPILGIPSFDQAERQIEWARQEQVTLNEYYRVTCSLALIQAKVGQIGTITEPRHALINQQCRIRAMAPGPDAGTVELILQKHSDGAYTDQSVETPFTRAQADSSYTPRSVAGKLASSPAPILTEVAVSDPVNSDGTIFRIKVEFKPPERDYEGSFSRATKIRDVNVLTSGGSIPGGQVLFVEVAPMKAGLRGLASEYLIVVVPSGGNSNSFSLTCELSPEADQYILYVGNFPGQTYEQTVASSPGTAPFSITVTNLARNFGSIPPDPAFDHVSIFYKYNGSPNVLRYGGRTFSPTETVVEFEPELPAAADTQVTVYVSSTNAAEDDFYPIEISPKATLTLTYEAGPAMDWTATLLPGPTPSSVVAKFTRPKVNGKRLFWVAAQVKDSGTGEWRALDANTGAAVTYYDGSAISHESIAGLKIKKDPGQPVGFGTAKADDLIMLDVAGGSFDKDRCQWGTVEKFLDDLGAETTAANARYIAITGGLFRPQTTQDLRMKIVKPPHTWDTEGYLGGLIGDNINGGVFWEWIGDREGDEFILEPREIGRDINSVDVRFWLENDYCRSGGGGSYGIVSLNAVKVRAAMDSVIPGPVVDLTVTGGAGVFTAKWKDPTTGAATIDDVGLQYATDPAFTTGVVTTQDWGDVNTLSGTDPGKTYYWRVAVHNLSDAPSDASTAADLGATGWGPWTTFGAPTAVSSGNVGPVDSVIPGPVQSLEVTGGNGNYVADWLDPATGNLTLDDIAIQYATDAGFTAIAGTAAGWGKVNHLQSTAPLTTYYFRVAAHNQSGLASHSSTIMLGATGWGPWQPYGAPTAVSSGSIPGAGAPTDSVIPGQVQNLVVSGGNGDFKADWDNPATGNLSIDDTAIQYALDSGFTQIVGTDIGWGPVTHLQSTAPDKTYWFRIAVHNQSGLPSHATTAGVLGATGWGPWAAYGAVVYSGLIPLDPVQISEQVVPNGSFEISSDGAYPDGWILFETGVGGGAWSWHSHHNEGAYGVALSNNTTGKFGIASRSFPVRAGELLTASVWASMSGSLNQGLFFRMFFHASNPDFVLADSPTQIDIVSLADPPFADINAWKRFEGQFTVPAGMGWCRAALYNWGAANLATTYHFDDVQVLRQITKNEVPDNTLPPSKWTGEGRTEFVETWEEGVAKWWTVAIQTGGTHSIVETSGVDGGKVFRANGGVGLYSNGSFLIPYDPRKLYRMTVRMRAISWTSATTAIVYAGITCWGANKAFIGEVYPVYNAYNGYGTWTANLWYESTGFFKALGAAIAPAPDSTNPSPLPTGTAYIAPCVYMSWSASASPSTDVMECDDIRIDVLEEEQYTTRAPNGSFSGQSVVVAYPWGDNKSSAIIYYWTYTQGLIKADQFAVYLSDGTAYHVARVKALPTSGPYELGVYSVIFNRNFNCSVQAEAIGAAGTVNGPYYDFPTILPNPASGTAPPGATNAGRVEWAGGNIWYDSEQYRNNQAPTNGTLNSLSVTFIHGGGGHSNAVLSNISYTQGAYIATHLAIYLRTPQGTLNLNADMVITYMSFGSLPSSYIVPTPLADNRDYTLGVVAVAECKNGRIFNSTYGTPAIKTIGAVGLLCPNTPADGQGRRVLIGNTSGGDTIQVFGGPAYGDTAIYFDEGASGSRRARVGGNATAAFLVNGSNAGVFITPGTLPNFGLNLYSAANFGNSAGGVLAIPYGWVPTSTPTDGGVIVVDGNVGGAAKYYGPSGGITTFGAGGPHCAKCGYDFWLVAAINPQWDAYLAICGWCGAKYKKGPKTAFHLLTDEQKRNEIIGKRNATKLLGGATHAEIERPRKARLGRRGAGRRRQSSKGRMRRVRGRHDGLRRRN